MHHREEAHASRSQLRDQIDLLVEGELSSEARSNLLLQLDAHPAHWRTLAISFVEHQILQKSVKQVCEADSGIEPVQSLTRPAASIARRLPAFDAPWRSGSLWWATALCVCLCLAFVIGYEVGGSQVAQAKNMSRPVAPSQPTEIEDEGQSMSIAGPVAPRDSRAVTSQKDPVGGMLPSKIHENIVGYVEWMDRHGKQLSPVFEGSEIDAEWMAANPPQINQQLQRTLTRAGWHVTPARKLVSLKFSDGSRFMIPMDDVSYRYVGREIL